MRHFVQRKTSANHHAKGNLVTDRTTTPELPDDPRDCCRAAIRILNGNRVQHLETPVGDVLAVTFMAMGTNSEADVA